MGGKARLNKKPKRMVNKARNEAVQGFASLSRQRNYTRAHKRDGVKDGAK